MRTIDLVRAAVAWLAAGVLLAGCGSTEFSDVVPDAAATDARGCPHQDQSANQLIAIDWVPLVVVDGVQYQQTIPEATVEATATGRSVGEVRCRIADEVVDPSYALQDGDATYLDVGTRLREIRGYDAGLRIAAESDDGWLLYEVVDLPDATTAADLLDIDGRVARLDLLGGQDGDQVIATVRAPAEVDRLVSALLAAPLVDTLPEIDENAYFLLITLDDGTTVRRAWWREGGLLQPRIVVPPELTAALAPRT
jgi:hypothetical protein